MVLWCPTVFIHVLSLLQARAAKQTHGQCGTKGTEDGAETPKHICPQQREHVNKSS